MRHATPPPLIVAASIVAVQGLALAGIGVVEALSIHGGRVTLGATTALFFLAYAGLLIVGANALRQSLRWPRAPVLLTQLIVLGLAWNLKDTPLVAVGLALVAVITAAGLLHPASMAALDEG